MGKSHLIAFTSMLLIDSKPDSSIYVVYSSKDLLDKDTPMLDGIKTVLKSGLKLKQTLAKTNIRPKSSDFILIDECDEVYFSNLDWFENTMKAPTIIGFTATPPT